MNPSRWTSRSSSRTRPSVSSLPFFRILSPNATLSRTVMCLKAA